MSALGWTFVVIGSIGWLAGLATLILTGLVKEGGTALRLLQSVLVAGALVAWAGTFWLFATVDEYLPVLLWATVNFAAIVPIGGPIFFLFTIPARRRRGWLPPAAEHEA